MQGKPISDFKRTPRPPSVHCGKCGKKLNYEYGSIAWRMVESDVCGACQAREDAKKSFEKHKPKLISALEAQRR